MGRATALLLAALAVGIGVGYLLAAGSTEGTRAERPPPAVTRREPAGPTPPPRETGWQGALDSVETPERPRGDGVVSGRVLTAHGDPVPDALVFVFPRRHIPTTRDWGGIYDRSLDERVREFVKVEKWRDRSRVVTRTDSSGRYRLTNLAREHYWVHARCEGFSLKRSGHRQPYVMPDATLDFVAHAVVGLKVEVVSPDGSPVHRAVVYYNREMAVVFAAHPWLQLQPGDYTLQARMFWDQWAKSDKEEVTIELEDEPHPVVLRIRQLPGLKGAVLVPEGLRPVSIGVRLLRFEGDAHPADSRLLREGRSATVGEPVGYEYAFSGLRPGKYLLGLTLDTLSICASKVVEVSESVVESDIALPAPDPSEYLHIRILDPDGAPVRRAEFRYYRKRGKSSESRDCNAMGRADGSYLVHPPEWQRENPGASHILTVRTRRFGLVSREVDPLDRSEILIRFAEPAAVEVTVEGFQDCPFRDGLKVAIVSPFEAETFVAPMRRGSVDETGERRVEAAQPGLSVLLLYVKRGRVEYVVAESPLQLRPGENRVSVSVPQLYTLTATGKPGIRIYIRSIDEGRIRRAEYRTIKKSGKAGFELLPGGSYELWKLGSRKRWRKRVRIPAQLEIRVPE